MNILFATGNPYMPEAYGGMQTSADELCRGLMRRGHQVAILSRFRREGIFGMMMSVQKKILGRKVSRDNRYGYPVWRAWFPWEELCHVTEREKFDLVVIMAIEPVRMALAAQQAGIPVLMLLQDVEYDESFRSLGAVHCVANSLFTAERYKHAFDVNPSVVFPFLSSELYRVNSTRENVTFINPVSEKGVDIALQVAERCREIPFVFVESWPLSNQYRHDLEVKLAKLSNVSLMPPQRDMRRVYRKCKILLVPSLWEEAYGRVVTEAQTNGIPVVASDRGGLREAVGDGGVLLDPEASIKLWVKVVRDLWSNDAEYDRLSDAALAWAKRPEMDFDYQITAYEGAMEAALRK